MTEEQKEILISKIIDTPSALTDMELNLILKDPELMDLYEMSSSVSGAYKGISDIDIENEWELFRPSILKKPRLMTRVMRIAAVFLGILLCSSMAWLIYDLNSSKDTVSGIALADKNPQNEDISSINEPEEEMAEAEMPEVQAKPESKASKVVRPSQNTEEIDIEEYLRIQQARIDNELALLNAEIYKEEFNELIPILESAGISKSYIESEINRLTMQ